MKRFAALLASLSLLACAGAQDSSGTTASALADSLRRAGLTVSDAGTVEQPFFSVPAHVYVVEERDLQIYEFANAAQAAEAAATVAPSGSTIGTSKMIWLDAPHFFRKTA